MGKSKFQVKAQETIIKKSTNPSGRAKYYDEDIPKKNSNNIFFAVFIIAMVIVAGGIIGNTLYQNNQETQAKDFLLPAYIYTYTDTSTSTSSTPTSGLKLGDTVELEYTLYIANPGSGVTGKIMENVLYQGPASFTTELSANLIYGFYANVLGMKLGEEKEFYLEANINADNDGYDDNTHLRTVSYTSGDLANTNLLFRVKILYIQ